MPAIKEMKEATTNGGKKQREVMAPGRQIPPVTPTVMHPMSMMRRFADEADRLFEDFGLGIRFHFPGFLSRGHELVRRETGMVPAGWSPRVDVIEREGTFMIRADLPGLTKDDIKVEVGDNVITIEGERRAEKKQSREGYLYSECNYGTFYRAIPLPEGADASKATAEFRDGVLEVTMPAPTVSKPQAKRLEVHEKK